MSARKAKPARKKAVRVPAHVLRRIEIAVNQLRRTKGVLTAIAVLDDLGAELSLSACAICARDQLDRVVDGLAELMKAGVRP